jgi:hypothetical protein
MVRDSNQNCVDVAPGEKFAEIAERFAILVLVLAIDNADEVSEMIGIHVARRYDTTVREPEKLTGIARSLAAGADDAQSNLIGRVILGAGGAGDKIGERDGSAGGKHESPAAHFLIEDWCGHQTPDESGRWIIQGISRIAQGPSSASLTNGGLPDTDLSRIKAFFTKNVFSENRMKNSSRKILAAAAVTGLLSGAALHQSRADSATNTASSTNAAAGKVAPIKKAPKVHDCAGQNDCKGIGGCKTDAHDCKFKNSCKGKGGCEISKKDIEKWDKLQKEKQKSS